MMKIHRTHLATSTCVALALLWGTSTQATTVQIDVRDGDDKPLADAVVFLESAEAKRLVKPLAAVEMGQEQKQFVPAVLAITVGTEVSFPNRDTVRHHVYSFSPATKFEPKLYIGKPANPVTFDRAGVVVMGCNIHDQMTGWILVVETPYLGKSPAAGKVTLDNVPAGTYLLRTWHTRLPVGAAALSQPFTVPPSGTAVASVRMTGLAP